MTELEFEEDWRLSKAVSHVLTKEPEKLTHIMVYRLIG